MRSIFYTLCMIIVDFSFHDFSNSHVWIHQLVLPMSFISFTLGILIMTDLVTP